MLFGHLGPAHRFEAHKMKRQLPINSAQSFHDQQAIRDECFR